MVTPPPVHEYSTVISQESMNAQINKLNTPSPYDSFMGRSEMGPMRPKCETEITIRLQIGDSEPAFDWQSQKKPATSATATVS